MLKLKEPEESESELEHRSSRVRSSKVGVGYKRDWPRSQALVRTRVWERG